MSLGEAFPRLTRSESFQEIRTRGIQYLNFSPNSAHDSVRTRGISIQANLPAILIVL